LGKCVPQCGRLLAEAEEEQEEDAQGEERSLEERIDGAVAQCLHMLYGVALPYRDPEWGSMQVRDAQNRHHMPCFWRTDTALLRI
jgi:hypothetical protein